jgi:antagonist of KipI
MSIVAAKAGALTTLQDLGRFGYQRFGIVVGGAMDEMSHRAANLLVNNAETEATLEITLMGPSLVFGETALIAICGADLSPHVGVERLPMGRPVLLRAGSRLDFGVRKSGCRAYLAIHGGYKVDLLMHSKSTYVRGGFGGFEGRPLHKGDELMVDQHDAERVYPALGRMLEGSDASFVSLPVLTAGTVELAQGAQPIRVMRGQQWEKFSSDAQSKFTTREFRVTPDSDRMGFRLDGEKIVPLQAIEMISEAVAFGTVQVPPDGNPIVLMADRQATGGYPKLADVASVDLPALAQLMPNQRIRFELISVDQAQELYLERERRIRAIAESATALMRGS